MLSIKQNTWGRPADLWNLQLSAQCYPLCYCVLQILAALVSLASGLLLDWGICTSFLGFCCCVAALWPILSQGKKLGSHRPYLTCLSVFGGHDLCWLRSIVLKTVALYILSAFRFCQEGKSGPCYSLLKAKCHSFNFEITKLCILKNKCCME